MVDLPALPIAFALTLWDALPVFLSISLALAIAARAALSSGRFQSIWRLREAAGIEGLVYVTVFIPSLLPVIGAGCIAQTLAAWHQAAPVETIPPTPGRALRSRAEEVIIPVLIASLASSYIKVAGPDISERGMILETLVAVLAGGLVGNRSGVVAIPAVAIMVHLGGTVQAVACVLAATIHSVVLQRRSVPVATEA